MSQLSFFDSAFTGEVNPNDIVFTPKGVAAAIVDIFKPNGKCVDPCKGNGAFLEFLPKDSDWCEIREGKDFFEYRDKVDWLVSNPPYSLWDEWLDHSFEIADNCVYLVPVAKVWKSWGTIKKIKAYGGIAGVWMIPASRCGFPFGFPCGAFHFKRGYNGPMDVMYAPD